MTNAFAKISVENANFAIYDHDQVIIRFVFGGQFCYVL